MGLDKCQLGQVWAYFYVLFSNEMVGSILTWGLGEERISVDTFNGYPRRCRKWLLKCTLRIAISALRSLGTNYYFSSTSVCQLLLGFERWIMLTREMGDRGGIPGRAETLAKESGRRCCVEKRGECQRGRDETSKGAGWRAQMPFRPVPGSGCLLLNPWFSNIIVFEKSSRLG